MGKKSTYPTIAGSHHTTHEPGGEDVVVGVAPGAHEASHVLGGADAIDSGLDARALNLANQGEIVYRAAAANTLAALAVGAAGQALLSGGVGADPSWGAPAPAAHAASHQSGGADKIRDVELNTALADLTASGLKSPVQVGENVVGGDVLFMQSDGKYWKADADAAASMPAKVMAIEAIAANDTGLVLHVGYYRNDALYNWVLGAGEANLLYVSTTPGAMTQTAPSGTGDQVQVVGYVVTADIVFFNPSYVVAEVA